MSLATGTRLGPYEVAGLIGEGGMGEVYRARDTRLERSVAIKVLPADLAADPERRARFEREARTISTLTHPHICALYDVGDHAGVPYLVMEHLAGETLAARLLKGPLPLEQALDVGAQVAEALDAAHKHGIVHRDLKPANVMLTKAGAVQQGALQAKLLDFGLAKLRPPEGVRLVRDSSAAVTRARDVTTAGTLVGTLPYMAPEQVEGREADARTDLWALGCLLYEMLTGQRAFEGTTTGSLVGAILAKEPPPLATRQPLTPPALERLVKRCLAKDPDQRWDSAHDVADELRWISTVGGQVTTSTPGAASAGAGRGWSRRRAWLFGAVLAVLGIIGGAAVTWLLRPPSPPPDREVRHLLLDLRPADGLRGIPRDRPSRTELALTPDGRRVVFTGGDGNRSQLYVRDFRDVEAKPIPNTEGASAPFLSPDGRALGFWADGTLKRVTLDGGGPPIEICKVPVPFGASWGEDGTIVFASGETSGLWRVSSDGGTPEAITTPGPGEYGHRLPHLLPGSRAVLFSVVEQPWNWEAARVVVHRFGTKGWQVLLPGAADARYVPTGHLIYFRRGRLMAVPFDLERLEKTGSEVGLIADVMQSTNGLNTVFDLGAAQVATAATGTLAYVAGGEVPDVKKQLIWVDRRGQVEALSAPPRPYYAPRLSPDGHLVAVETLQSARRIWVHDVRVTGSLVPVTSPELEASQPAWTRDGERLAFTAAPAGRLGLFWARADGTQPPERLSTAERIQTPASWTPDGQLAYVDDDDNFDIWLLSRQGDQWSGKALLSSQNYEGDAQVSPEGRWIAYTSDESGRKEVYVRRFPSLADRRPVSAEGGREPVWARNGRELFYLRGSSMDALEMVVHDVGPDGAIAPTGRPLFRLAPIRAENYIPVPGFDVTPDGKRFLFAQYSDTPSPPPPKQIHVVFNWFEELKAKVPTAK